MMNTENKKPKKNMLMRILVLALAGVMLLGVLVMPFLR